MRMPETHRNIGDETARFQAFQDRNDDLPPAWQMKASGPRVGMLVAIVVVVAILALIIGVVMVG